LRGAEQIIYKQLQTFLNQDIQTIFVYLIFTSFLQYFIFFNMKNYKLLLLQTNTNKILTFSLLKT